MLLTSSSNDSQPFKVAQSDERRQMMQDDFQGIA